MSRVNELAMSPVGRDQLMSLALERCALTGDPDASLIDLSDRSAERARIAQIVFGRGPRRSSATEALVVQIEEEHARRLVREARFDLLPERLLRDAILQELLWDHPNIPATNDTRLAMLCSVPRLRERSEDLSSGWSWGALPRSFNAFLKRAAR